mmetsp:Transcript_67453/g.197261  ORF Transcript_67453/g.197261 Transcript_67453/m.197261 type:complete len:223 (+) Transcript_67453:1470-2138(+)
MSAYVECSSETSSIISPPPRKGGDALSNSARPQRKPMPVGPHILWLLATSQSAPRLWTSTGMCGMLWQASTRTLAPTACAFSEIHSMGLTHPRTFETWHIATSRVRSPSSDSNSAASRTPSGVTPTKRSRAPAASASCCQGTRLEWCSMTLRRISSPAPTFAAPQLRATRLMASVAFRVKTISVESAAPTKSATFARAPSKASVERMESVCMPRWTLLLSWL